MSESIHNSFIGSILLDFPVLPSFLGVNEDDQLDNPVCTALQPTFGKLEKVYSGEVSPGKPSFGRLALYSGDKGVTTTIRTYPSRSHVTVTIEYDLKEFKDRVPLSFDGIKELELGLAKTFQAKKKTNAIPQIKRALDFDTYFTTSDDRILEYDVKEMVFDAWSDFQHIQICKSGNYGNVLVLDGYVNLAEADLAYTEAIMCRGKVDYKGKDVLILGGGDGALLNELRKEGARKITMIEIDDVVMQACKKHLRLACEDTLDTYVADNYEVIVGDCIPFMHKCQAQATHFDFIFGDLTDIPISPTPQGEIWDFVKQILTMSFAILKQGGTYFTHANGISAAHSLHMFESTVKDCLGFPVTLEKTYSFVPSFKEKWVFYQIRRNE